MPAISGRKKITRPMRIARVASPTKKLRMGLPPLGGKINTGIVVSLLYDARCGRLSCFLLSASCVKSISGVHGAHFAIADVPRPQNHCRRQKYARNRICLHSWAHALRAHPLRTSSKIATQLKEKPLKVFSGICARASGRRLVHVRPADACMKSFKGLRKPS